MQSHQREWNETKSPQWRYLLSKDHEERRAREKRERSESDYQIKANRKGRKTRERIKRERVNKKGQPIVYSARPGERWFNEEFRDKQKTKIDPNKELRKEKSNI